MKKEYIILIILGLLGLFGLAYFMYNKKNKVAETKNNSEPQESAQKFVSLGIKNKNTEDLLNELLTEEELKEVRRWIFNYTKKWNPDNEPKQVADATYQLMKRNLLPSYPSAKEWEDLSIQVYQQYGG